MLLLTETFATTEKQLGTHFVYHSLAKKNQKRGRPSGGLAIAIRKNLNVTPKTKAATDNYLIVELDSKLTVVVMYFKPDTPVEDIVYEISNAFDDIETDKIVIGGDFNCRLDLKATENRAQFLVDHMKVLGLNIVNDSQPTFKNSKGTSCIDLLFTNIPTDQLAFYLRHAVSTCHIPVGLQIKFEPVKYLQSRPPPIKRVSLQQLRDDMKIKLYSRHPSTFALDELINYVQIIIQDSKLQKRTRKNPWFDSECRAQLFKIKTADKSDLQALRKEKAKYKKLCFEKKKNYEYSKELETIIKAQTDRTAFWNIKKSKPQQATVSAVPSYKWIQHFTELFKDDGDPSITLIKPKEEYLDDLDRPIAPLKRLRQLTR